MIFQYIIFSFFLFLLPFEKGFGETEVTDRFVIKISFNSIEVLSPKLKNSKVSVVIDNTLFTSLIGQLRDEHQKVLCTFNLAPKSTQFCEVNLKEEEKLFFYPLSPPRQEVMLKFGQERYEMF